MKQENTPTTQPPKDIDKRLLYRGNKKQKLFMEYWTNPQSKTFANVYQSGLKAGFSPTYSKNIANVAPQWLTTFIDKIELTETHIEQGISKIATGDIDSRSIDDTRLKAFELLMKLKGLDKNTSTTNINIVQPILSGIVEKKQDTTPKAVIDLED
jgi:hypothetical protein